ncbi:hypothetical protein HME9304_00090 [Flagellimonas maritima]|uniref:Uncharacterized protein n=1 Tax=Flagellimonas maritima TaxID=1383885 RepID=A0A2Z4LMT0_9FLAO|nr:hypothetical protein [Allomuricauda aurantiaca]AWX43103.1 hypothetical protein HME9304_00090 [Allomuricauda aurantiaca]
MDKKKKNTFNTPEGYFESFHERLMDKMQGQEIRDAIAIIPKTDGFGVPDGYFENLDQKIISKTDQKQIKVIRLTSVKKLYYSAAAIAAIFILIFGITWNDQPQLSFDDLANAEIDSYFNTMEFGLSSYEIAEIMEVEEISMDDILETELNEENILEYLNENVEDIEDLNLEYNDYE